jgi:hypothetical protein
MFVGACSFETQVPPPGNFATPDAPQTPDAAPVTPDAPPAQVCAAAYVSVPAAQTQSKYRRVQVQTPWLSAKANCAADGGHLVVPNTPTEATAIFAFIDPLDTSPYYWAGISDPEQDGQWMTVMGSPFTVPAWGANNPQQRVGEIYAIVYSDGSYFDWFDDGSQEYACECEP